MGECLITRRGGESYELPVLNANYPQDVSLTVIKGNSTSATFSISIATAGKPAEYTYQWYVNGSAVSGATGSSYTKTGLTTSGTYSVYCEVTNKAGVVTSRVATLKVEQYYTPVLNTNYPANANKTYITGNTASAQFSVIVATAGNPTNYTYQWYVNDVAVSGATSSTYNWTGTEGSYNVYCKVTNAAGSVDSRTATLSVTRYYTPVLNSSYPANASKTYITGNTASATFEVKIATAGVPASYTYQWYLNNSAISGATGSTYTWTGTEGTYNIYCKVTNAAGSIDSRTATLSVTRYYTPTLNTSYPANASKTYITGNTASATFEVKIATAGRPTSYTYQWYVNNTAVSGATNSTYNWSGTEGSYSIYCKVTNAAGSVDSRIATLNVTRYYTPTLNSSYPANASKTYISGNTASATFEVKIATAGKPTSYTYQWYLNNSAVSGATSSSYTWTGTEGSYNIYCKVTNSAGSVNSRTATLTVTKYYTPTLNSSYPANVTVTRSSSASAKFEVKISTAGKPASYTYQWYVNGSAVSGATSSSYTRSGLNTAGTFNVYCKVSNSAGSVNSRTAVLTVNDYKPTYTYNGTATMTDEGNGNWNVVFKTGGTFKFTNLGNSSSGIDVFCVGGGGGAPRYCGGAGGGYTKTQKAVSVAANTPYTITIGAGGASYTDHTNGGDGGKTSAFGVEANGGKGAIWADIRDGDPEKMYAYRVGADGGSGGGGYAGTGGTDGADGTAGEATGGGKGQGTTTRAFGESSGTLYSSGGDAPGDYVEPAANTGDGAPAGVSYSTPYNGASGIVIIRNKR